MTETECRMLEAAVKAFGPMTIDSRDGFFYVSFARSKVYCSYVDLHGALHWLLECLVECVCYSEQKVASLEKELEQLKAAVLEKELEQLKKETP